MKPRKRPSGRALRKFTSSVHPTDGTDPRFDRPDGGRGGGKRKTRQLCAQVADALGLVVAGCGDDVLRNLYVVSVDPAPDESRLLVTLGSLPNERADPIEVMTRVAQVAPGFRHEVASSITRRRVPQLDYRYVAAPDSTA